MSNDKQGFFASLGSYLKGLVNEHHELAAWGILGGLAGAVYAGKAPIDWPVVTLAFLALFVLLGSRRFRGLSFGPDGVEVAGKPAAGGTAPPPSPDEVAQKVRAQLEGPLKSFAEYLQETEMVVPLSAVDLTTVDGIGEKTAAELRKRLSEQGTTTVTGLLERETLPVVDGETEAKLRSHLERTRPNSNRNKEDRSA